MTTPGLRRCCAVKSKATCIVQLHIALASMSKSALLNISLSCQVNMKDYAQYKSTFVKPKQSKAIANAIEEIEKYCKGMILLHTIIHIAMEHTGELCNISKSRLVRLKLYCTSSTCSVTTLCFPGRGESTTPIGGGGDGVSDEDDEEEFDQLISGTPTSTKVLLNTTPLIWFIYLHL